MKTVELKDYKFNVHHVLDDWENFIHNRPVVDMKKCKLGTRVLTSKGNILIYDRCHPNATFPHFLKKEGSIDTYTRTDEGWTYRHSPLPTDEDIVYIFED